jgi:hypothetical protein
LILRSEPTAVEGTSTRAEIYFGNVQLLFVRPVYEGIHVRVASTAQREDILQRLDIAEALDAYVYLLSLRGLDFVVSSTPAWREARRGFDEPSLFDFGEPWPCESTATWGEVD